MKSILVTGGTAFVSRAVAEHFARLGYAVSILNRGTKAQPSGTTLIKADRHNLGELKAALGGAAFDAIIDVTAYTANDITLLVESGVRFGAYVLVSSSAVYPETASQPFDEDTPLGRNAFWGDYGTNKIAAENALAARVPNAYIVRPPYLYGAGNNVYREAFVFDCAMSGRAFYLPGEGELKLQFFHVQDLCRFMQILIEEKPADRVFNVGNAESVSVREWVSLCYAAAGKSVQFVRVPKDANIPQRNYFPFHDYEYALDVTRQSKLLPQTIPLAEGLRDSFDWYCTHSDEVNKKPLISFIDDTLAALPPGAK